MANTNRAFGFRPTYFIGGSPWNGEQTLYAFSASNSTGAAYNGDAVAMDTTVRSLALTDVYAPGCPTVKPIVAGVTTTQVLRGIIVGFVPEPEYTHSATASLGLMYRADDTKRYVWVVDHPDVAFVVQEDGNDYVTAADNSIGKTGDLVYAAGNATTGVSGTMIDSSDINNNAVRPFKVLRYNRAVDNFGFTAADTNSYAKLDVIMWTTDMKSNVTDYNGL